MWFERVDYALESNWPTANVNNEQTDIQTDTGQSCVYYRTVPSNKIVWCVPS